MSTDQMHLPEPLLPGMVAEPAREWVDVSPTPWREGALSDDTDRFPMMVPRQVAAYVHQQKMLAGATVAADGAFKVHALLAKLTKETAPARGDLNHMDADYENAKKAGATPRQLEAIQALQLAARQQTAEQLQAAVQRVVQPVRLALADAERAAMRALEEGPSTAPSEDDYSTCGEIALTLDLIPPPVAAKVLMQRLVLDPAKTGKIGLTAAMLPLLRGRLSDPRYDGCFEFKDLIEQAQIICRDQHYHAAHMRLRTAGELTYKLDRLAGDALTRHGVETAASNPFYQEFTTAS